MCGPHHKQVDDDPSTYTTEVLLKLKADHETAGVEVAAEDDVVDELLQTYLVQVFNAVVQSFNQTGGQTAFQITNVTNVGSTRRSIPADQVGAFLRVCTTAGAGTVAIASPLGDGEAGALAHALRGLLEQAGWTVTNTSQTVWDRAPQGIGLQIPSTWKAAQQQDPALLPPEVQALGAALVRVGIVGGRPFLWINGKPNGDATLLVGHNVPVSESASQ